MAAGYFNQIIDGTWKNPDTGQPIGVLIKQVVIGDVCSRPQDMLDQLEWSRKHLSMVCDEHTYKVVGSYLDTIIPHKIVLPGGVKPTLEVIQQIRRATQEGKHLLAVGSGTINDICKYASSLNNQPYAVFATAPSMNGYASINASVIDKGFRTSVVAQLPVGIFMDIATMMQAPLRLIQSGVGDMICRGTAQADWLLSHKVCGTSYMQAPFSMLKGEEVLFYQEVHKLLSHDEEVMTRLLRLLILSGLGMTLCKGSYPASQGEHMISHTMEMVYGGCFPMTYHGEEIGVTTLTMAQLQEACVGLDSICFSSRITKAQVEEFYGAAFQKESMAVYHQKLKILERCREVWQASKEDICKQIKSVMVPVSTVRHVLESIRAKIDCVQLGWQEAPYQQAVKFARYSRNRWTFLDMV